MLCVLKIPGDNFDRFIRPKISAFIMVQFWRNFKKNQTFLPKGPAKTLSLTHFEVELQPNCNLFIIYIHQLIDKRKNLTVLAQKNSN